MSKKIQRKFFIGDQWLYYKIYTGTKIADFLLSSIFKPICKEWIDNKIIDKWFFIRYQDPHPHLRIRFLTSSPSSHLTIMLTLNEKLKNYFEEGIIWNTQLDIYNRELERYGENTIELVESIFFIDSQSVVDLIYLLQTVQENQFRWLFSLKAMDNLMTDFNLTLEEKLKLTNHMKTNFTKEFKVKKPLRNQINERYRIHRQTISNFIKINSNEDSSYDPLIQILNKRNKELSNSIKDILSHHKNKTLRVPINNLIVSLIHMFINRLFSSENRANELVLYNFLFKFYMAKKNKVSTY